jgi:spermidine/putrescine transport system substrate-binding protein
VGQYQKVKIVRGYLMKKLICSLLLAVLVIASSGGVASADTDWQCPEGFEGQTLRVFNWAQYVADSTIPDFEEACGVTVEYSEYGATAAMLTVIETENAQYDIVVMNGALVPNLVSQDLLQPLDYSLLPNLESITFGPNLEIMNPPMDYLMPYQFGTIGIAYDVNAVSQPMATWEDFFAYEGRVAWQDDASVMLGIALTQLGLVRLADDPAQYQQAADFLLTVPQNDVFAIAASTQSDLLLQGEVDAIIDRSRNVVRMIQDCECEDFAYVLPSDGFMGDFDAMVIPANAQNPALAHAFIDYILLPQTNADLSSALGSATPIMEARGLVDEAILNNDVSYPSIESIRDILMGEGVMIENFGQEVQAPLNEWNRVKAELVSQ